jgi:formate hydrogenlyase subunit 3/multisubunit Na+/H+ antiporter MnhD subunit
MEPILIAVAVWSLTGLLARVRGRSARWASACGVLGAVAGGALTVAAALNVLLCGARPALRWPWSIPLGSFNLALDPLSAVFALAIGGIGALAAVYAVGYLAEKGDGPGDEPNAPPRKNVGGAWFFFNLLLASMLLVVTARNGLLFLMSWELMSLASFFLVMFEGEKPGVREAGWTYLVTTHLGTALLLAMFALLSRKSGSLDFDALGAPGLAGTAFLLGLIGFGTKAGLMPLHVWLPEAHPAAPSFVSAVMSGVMIKTGIYGLLRMLTWLGEPPAWWGWTLLAMGVVSGVGGVLYALSQHDLKRLLAYHSVENIGIIAMAMGVGLLGVHYQIPAMAALGYAAALLHVVNHALFKSLLFLGAGSVLHAAGTGEIDRLGGLLKRMPVTGATFLIGAAAISGLPPLNGFVSEFLLYLGAAMGLGSAARTIPAWTLMSVLVIGGLALISGLAAACFTKAFGIVFLGEPRSAAAAEAHEAGAAMRWPMAILAALCVAVGLSAPLWPRLLSSAVSVMMPAGLAADAAASVRWAVGPLTSVVCGSCVLLGLIVALAYFRRKLLAGRRVELSGTWDCGYAAPNARMQYTASSFARPLTSLFRLFLQPCEEIHEPRGLFPERAGLHTHAADLFRRGVYGPVFAGIGWIASKLRWLQEWRIQIYVLYIALTILILFIWKLG